MQERLRDNTFSPYERSAPSGKTRKRTWVDRATDERHGVGRVNLIVVGFVALAVLSLFIR